MRRFQLVTVVIVLLLTAVLAYYYIGSSTAIARTREAERRQQQAIDALDIPGLQRLRDKMSSSDEEIRKHWIVDHTPILSSFEETLLGADYSFGAYGDGQHFYLAEGTTTEVCRRIALVISARVQNVCIREGTAEDLEWCARYLTRQGMNPEDLCQPAYEVRLPPVPGFSGGYADISRVLVDPSESIDQYPLPDAFSLAESPGEVSGEPATVVETDYYEQGAGP